MVYINHIQIWSCVRLLTMPFPSSRHTYTPRLLWSSAWSWEEGWYEPCPGLAHKDLPQEELHVPALQTWKPHTDDDRATKRKQPGPQNLPLEEHPRNITLDSTWVKNKSVLCKPLKMCGFFMTLPCANKAHGFISTLQLLMQMYRCEIWTIKNAKCQRIDALNCGAGEDSWESLWQQGDQTSQS